MKILCPHCGKPLVVIDTKLRANGEKRRTRLCRNCKINFICSVYANCVEYDKMMYMESESIDYEQKK